jgi:hypothetical protein
MNKEKLIVELSNFLKGEIRSKGQKSFGKFFIEYLRRLDIAAYYEDIMPYLPELIVDAFEQLRVKTDDNTTRFRKAYENETGWSVPNITDLGESNSMDQSSAVQTTGFLFKEITNWDWLENKIDTYCNAQRYVLQQTFDKFLRQVYRNGLFEIISQCQKRGMSGEFGNTVLRTHVSAARIMFTFARKQEEGEVSVSFLAAENDNLALGAGIQSIYADFFTSINMIEDVINYWPTTEKEKNDIYKENEKVSVW